MTDHPPEQVDRVAQAIRPILKDELWKWIGTGALELSRTLAQAAARAALDAATPPSECQHCENGIIVEGPDGLRRCKNHPRIGSVEQHDQPDDEGRHLLPTDAEILSSLVPKWPPNI
jgi:hypothetical protein